MRRTLLTVVAATVLLVPLFGGSTSSSATPATVVAVAGCSLGGPTSYLYCNKTPRANFVMKHSDGTYYSYASGGEDGFPVYTSPDLLTWTPVPADARPQGSDGQGGGDGQDPDWLDADPRYWPPEVIERNGKFYMFYSAVASADSKPRTPSCQNNHFIGLAIADSPTGPFIDIGRPLMGGSGYNDADGTPWGQTRTIDPNPFVDVDGTVYLYFTKPGRCYAYNGQRESRIFVAKLRSDLKQLASDPVMVLKPSQAWESQTSEDNIKNEAPAMLRRDDRYYLMYSANGFNDDSYAVGYAVSTSPTGPFNKFNRNPIISSVDGIEKAGHNHIIYSPDDRHVYTTYNTFEGKFLSRIDVRGDHTLYANGPYATIGSGTELRVAPKPSGAPIYDASGNQTNTVYDHAWKASATASSFVPDGRHGPHKVTDGEIGVQPRFASYDWQADGERAGAWVKLTWDAPRPVNTILIYPSADPNHAVSSGILRLNGATTIPVTFPSQPKAPAIIGPDQLGGQVSISELTFTVNGFASGATGNAALSDISVLGPPPTP
ncbi:MULTISPECIES: glycoside hydrolase family 43 protein [Nocardioides]|uniref:Glycoside hydrolase family 43 protein n=1 Tax=Nocardioides vastitatis TaxID=2568655 RepID=A0ABW0ZIZ9_9ACTN|nr:glycoside hydrolase family 43 protein [Nocardioides sp.]THJ08460.1 hypothetical protein E7Z54_04545 [Nocardioides sp.]